MLLRGVAPRGRAPERPMKITSLPGTKPGDVVQTLLALCSCELLFPQTLTHTAQAFAETLGGQCLRKKRIYH